MNTERSEKILVMVLLQQMKGATIAEKAHALSLAGFTHLEIANFLETTAAAVTQSLYEKRKKKGQKAKK